MFIIVVRLKSENEQKIAGRCDFFWVLFDNVSIVTDIDILTPEEPETHATELKFTRFVL